jgi:hypothetical protein
MRLDDIAPLKAKVKSLETEVLFLKHELKAATGHHPALSKNIGLALIPRSKDIARSKSAQ